MAAFLAAGLSLTSSAQISQFPQLELPVLDPQSCQEASFQEITETLDAWYEMHPPSQDENGLFIDGDFMRYQRWKHQWYYRLDNGDFPTAQVLDEYQALKNQIFEKRQNQAQLSQRASESWEALGPFQRSGGYWGMGRVTDIQLHPTEPDTYYVGAAKGGIWKTENRGASYTSLGDDLPYHSVGNIAVIPDNPDEILITLGDRTGWWNDGLGVYRSEDGGMTWTATNFTRELSDEVPLRDMKVSPVNSEFILLATGDGLYRSADGIDFELLDNGLPSISFSSKMPIQIIFHPADSATAYVVWWDYWGSEGGIFRTEDAGDTWTDVSGMTVPARTTFTLAHGHQNPDLLYAKFSQDGTRYIRRSDDRGDTWTDLPNIDETDGEILYVSPENDNHLYSGWFYVWKSEDGGNSFYKYAAWDINDVHVDHWEIIHNPLTDEMFWANDGGVWMHRESLGVWTEMNNDLNITQMYDIAVSQEVEGYMIMGSQDNGGAQRIGGGIWTNTNGGDAMTNAMDPNSRYNFLTGYVLGIALYRTSNAWGIVEQFEENIPGYPGTANWLSPQAMDPNNPTTIWVANRSIFRSEDWGDSFETMISNIAPSPILKIEVSPADPNYIYACVENRLFVSTDYGASWQTYFYPTNISNFDLHPFEADKLWITFTGYDSDDKVHFSEDAGATSTNISANMPNIPALSVLYDEQQEDLYLGTEVGVYKSPASLTEINWELMDNGLPLTQINDLEIQVNERILYVGTYGRGAYQLQLEKLSSGIEEQDASSYFMPSLIQQDVLTLPNADPQQICQLYDLSGKLRFEGSLAGSLNLGDLEDGFYIASLSDAQGTILHSQRVVIERSGK